MVFLRVSIRYVEFIAQAWLLVQGILYPTTAYQHIRGVVEMKASTYYDLQVNCQWQ